ncbi:MAG: GlsB/YeaQ/YmgE family stress response membrane protein [Propionibacteriaceae bacterium]|jgi:uncharacterized membrane protein YeaQ/YmgE (transglycosylase-associated protein family)|nr:GlsB/YeaQ/YmgE family stress response membrane protein [Propionibacteriaceae bacterium]
MGFLSFIILGLIVGLIARAIVPGRIGSGILPALVAGVVGSIVGGWISSIIFHVGLGHFFSLRTWIVAILGSVLVIVIYGALRKRS